MALRNQPYLPLYVQDFLTDEKLMECSASATGIYIRLMCILHKSDEYGTILLKQKDKQKENNCLNFAYKLAKFMPYTVDEILSGLTELKNEGVIEIDDDKLTQKRMVKDNAISDARALAGKKGGEKTQFAKANNKANDEANSESEYEIEYDIDNVIKDWRLDFNIYCKYIDIEFEKIKKDVDWIKLQESVFPKLDILKSIEKSIAVFWKTDSAWQRRKKGKSKKLDWKKTFSNTMEINKVEKQIKRLAT